MKYIVTIFSLLALPVFAQTPTKAVVKTISDNAITESVYAPSGKVVGVLSGGTLNYATGANFSGNASEFLADVGAQPLDADLTAIAALTTQPYGRSLLTSADATAAGTTLGLGAAAYLTPSLGVGGVADSTKLAQYGTNGELQAKWFTSLVSGSNVGARFGPDSLAFTDAANVGWFLYPPGNFGAGYIVLAPERSGYMGVFTAATGLPSLASEVTGTLPVANGGTNITSYTAGDLLYATGATTLTKLAKGTAGQVLTMNAGATAPEWAAAGGGLTIGTTAITSGTDGRLLFQAGGVVSQDADLSFVTDTLTATKLVVTSGSRLHNGNDDGVVIGDTAAGNTGATDVIAIGFFANGGLGTSDCSGGVAIGRHAFYDAIASNSVGIGHAAGQYASDSSNSVMIGYLAGRGGTSDVNLATHHAFSSVLIGHESATAALSAQNSVVIGAGAFSTGNDCSKSVVIGDLASRDASSASQSVIIGHWAGISAANLNNKLIIETNEGGGYNDGTAALIYGDFSTRDIRFGASTIGLNGVTTIAPSTAGTSLVITSGTVTSNLPYSTATQTWNNGAVVFDAITSNVTNIASATGSTLQKWSVGGTMVHQINPDGSIKMAGGNGVEVWNTTATGGNGSRSFHFNNYFTINDGNGNGMLSMSYLAIHAGPVLTFNTAGSASSSAGDVGLERLGAASLKITDGSTGHGSLQAKNFQSINGTTATTNEFYNTYTSSTNYERLVLDWQTVANLARIGTEKGSGGGTARDMALQTNAVSRHYFREAQTTLTDGADTYVFDILIPPGSVTGGELIATVESDDGTDVQASTDRFVFSAVNTSIGSAVSVNKQTTENSTTTSTGTLTTAWTLTPIGDMVRVYCNADSSLSGTLKVQWQVILNGDPVTVTISP